MTRRRTDTGTMRTMGGEEEKDRGTTRTRMA